jgi:hypothetical protein
VLRAPRARQPRAGQPHGQAVQVHPVAGRRREGQERTLHDVRRAAQQVSRIVLLATGDLVCPALAGSAACCYQKASAHGQGTCLILLPAPQLPAPDTPGLAHTPWSDPPTQPTPAGPS